MPSDHPSDHHDGPDHAAHDHAHPELHHDDFHHLHHDAGHDTHHPAVFGTPHEEAKHHHWQNSPVFCGTEVQREILESITGHTVTQVHAAIEATERGWQTSSGTLPDYIGRWLEYHHIPCHHKYDGNFLDIIAELRAGHKVIVGVNSSALWHSNDALSAFGAQAADHAIWLTGVDASDPAHVKVFINDSGKQDGAANVYDLHDLESVLNHSGIHYVATGHGPSHLPHDPMGYDADHGVFSGLDGFLHDHGHGLTFVGVAATAAVAAAALRSSRRTPPVQPAPGQTAPPHQLAGPPPQPRVALPAPPLRIEHMSRQDRDRLLRDL
jgi:hypothetical protein